MRIPSYDEWCDSLSDSELEELESTRTSLDDAYADFISDIQDEAYHEWKDSKLLEED